MMHSAATAESPGAPLRALEGLIPHANAMIVADLTTAAKAHHGHRRTCSIMILCRWRAAPGHCSQGLIIHPLYMCGDEAAGFVT